MIEILERIRGEETVATEELLESGAGDNPPPLSELLRDMVIEPWRPWWLAAGVEEIVVQSNPAVVPRLVPISELTSSDPKPALVFSIVEALYAYVLVMRLWNGDCRSDPQASFRDVLGVAVSLIRRAPPTDTTVQQVLAGAQERAVHPPVAVDGAAILLALHDLILVWQFTSAIHRALAELHLWAIRAAKKTVVGQAKKDQKFTAKKLFFYRCWASEMLAPGTSIHEQIRSDMTTLTSAS